MLHSAVPILHLYLGESGQHLPCCVNGEHVALTSGTGTVPTISSRSCRRRSLMTLSIWSRSQPRDECASMLLKIADPARTAAAHASTPAHAWPPHVPAPCGTRLRLCRPCELRDHLQAAAERFHLCVREQDQIPSLLGAKLSEPVQRIVHMVGGAPLASPAHSAAVKDQVMRESTRVERDSDSTCFAHGRQDACTVSPASSCALGRTPR